MYIGNNEKKPIFFSLCDERIPPDKIVNLAPLKGKKATFPYFP
jgi:hypothetical protein